MSAIWCRFLSFWVLFFSILSPLALSEMDPSLTDGKAKVYSVKGYAVILRQGNPIEKSLKVGDEIRAGDRIETGRGAVVSVQFDHGLKNAVRIPAESRAIFESLEPTVIRLEDGAIFNIVDGLAQGHSWKVRSPAAVAAVRGTVFVIRYGMSNGDYFAATVHVPDDGKNSMIEISSLASGESVRVVEGKALKFKKNEPLGDHLVQDLDPATIQDAADFYAEIVAERPSAEVSAHILEPIAEFTETTCDASGQNCSMQTCKMSASGKVCEYA